MARRFRKKRFRRRRRHKRKMPIVKLIKKVIQSQAEHKYKNFNVPATGIDSSGNLAISLFSITQGIDRDERIGNDVKFASLKIRYRVDLLDSSDTLNCRIHLVQNVDNTSPSNLPEVGELFPKLNESVVKYRVLFDKTHQLSLGINESIYRNLTIRKFPVKTKYTNPVGNSFDTGDVFMRVYSDDPTAGNLVFSMDYRITWTDI